MLCIVPGIGSFFKKLKQLNNTKNVQVTMTQDETWRLLYDRRPLAAPPNSYDRVPSQGSCTNSNASCLTHTDMKELRSAVDSIATAYTKSTNQEDCRRSIRREWKVLAKIMDRTFFMIYCVTIIFSLLVLFPKPEDFTFF